VRVGALELKKEVERAMWRFNGSESEGCKVKDAKE
jgi:hypothetical protein